MMIPFALVLSPELESLDDLDWSAAFLCQVLIAAAVILVACVVMQFCADRFKRLNR